MFVRAQERARADRLAEVDLAAVLECLRAGLTAARIRRAWESSVGATVARQLADHIKRTIARAHEILRAARGQARPKPERASKSGPRP